MAYNKADFLAGIAAGRAMKSWPVLEAKDIFAIVIKLGGAEHSSLTFSSLCSSAGGNGTINWGDGYVDTIPLSREFISHTYSSPGTYVVRFSLLTTFQAGGYAHGAAVIALLGQIPETIDGFEGLLNAFSYCSNLKTIPPKLFVKCSHITDFEQCFQDSGITEVPAGIFDKCIKAENFSSCFSRCTQLKKIPEKLFANCPEAMFFDGCFESTQIGAVPKGLFDNCSKAKNFSRCFYAAGVETIAPGTFQYCTNAQDFWSCFRSNYRLQAIPQTLFDNCPLASDFQYAFADCYQVRGTVPELWVSHPSAQGSGCFRSCTNVDNYADIPASWGGPA